MPVIWKELFTPTIKNIALYEFHRLQVHTQAMGLPNYTGFIYF